MGSERIYNSSVDKRHVCSFGQLEELTVVEILNGTLHLESSFAVEVYCKYFFLKK